MTAPKARPLPELLTKNRNAMTVYASLRWLAGEERQLQTTRAKIAAVCHLGEDTITSAIHALADCRWLILNYGREGLRAWYRLTFPVAGFFPVAGKARYSKPKRGGKKPVQRTVPCGRKKSAHTRKGIGVSYGPAPMPDAGAERTPAKSESNSESIGNDSDGNVGRSIVEILSLEKKQ